ncbi:sugar ABC transporter substrate-binding protein [Tepiditoga spiralis]|uniref:Sugar ABC transporter substrate-binding protein n=1 Tax=Tepiditoga spiralis TaxID=2108365 RepID=A0A7G1G8E0_9BACT|nr:extracellular solute-binding protein [Tepiditoga spiralis]BBE31676.1 sugar ABC transporter substrate-binding protein [Tepiditoga spiralis]
MKTKLLIFVLVIFSVLSFSKTKIVLWQFMMGDDVSKNILAGFEKENPDIDVEVVQLSWANGFDKIVTAFAANAAPDVLELGNTWVANFAKQGVLFDMSNTMKNNPEIVGWNQSEFNGKYWGVPWLLGTRAMYYNIDLFTKAGLDPTNPPKTWDEMLEAAKKIDALGSDIHGVAMASGEPYSPWQEWFLPAVWGNRGRVISKDLKKATFNSIEVQEAAKFYKDLSKYALKTKISDLQAAFGEGKIGMWITGSGAISQLSSTYPNTNFYVSYVPKPSNYRGFSASFAGGEILTISNQSKKKYAAVKLINYLTRPEVAMKITKRVPAIFPSNSKASNDPWFEDNPMSLIFFKQNATAVPVPPHPKWGDIQTEVTSAIEEIILNNEDINKTLDKYNKKIQEILDNSK